MAMLDFVDDREVAATVTRANHAERAAEKGMRRVEHGHFDSK